MILANEYPRIKSNAGNPMTLMEESINSDKRKHPRSYIDLPVRYSSRSNLFSKYGRAINVSEGGLLVHLPEEIVIGQRLSLRLFLHFRSELDIISPSVQVVWTGIHMRKDFTWDHPTGVKFVDIPPKDMIKLKDFLMNVTQKASDKS